jgi:hypothetical protein
MPGATPRRDSSDSESLSDIRQVINPCTAPADWSQCPVWRSISSTPKEGSTALNFLCPYSGLLCFPWLRCPHCRT